MTGTFRPSSGPHMTDSRAGGWSKRLEHVGNRVKRGVAPAECDIPWFRTEEEYEYITSALPVNSSLMELPGPLDWRELDPGRFFPNVTMMTPY